MSRFVKRCISRAVKATRGWLQEQESSSAPSSVPALNNTAAWLRYAFSQVDAVGQRPSYSWGVLQGVALAKVLGLARVSVFEFGVAGGSGLVKLEQIATVAEQLTGVGVDVYGFDTGKGLPKPQDYRDMPFLWTEGSFAMDTNQLKQRLSRAQLKLGFVEETVPEFLREGRFSPVAFVSIDLDLYTGTVHALRLLETAPEQLLPRIPLYFDDVMGHGCCEFTGERLAIDEFNAAHPQRKIALQHGLKHFVPPAFQHNMWPEMMYFAHIFDHPQYGAPSSVRGQMHVDIDGVFSER